MLTGRGAVVGIAVNYSPNGQCWQDSAVDWLVRGFRAAAEVVHTSAYVRIRQAYVSICILTPEFCAAAQEAELRADVLHVLRYVVDSPRMALIFLVRVRTSAEPPRNVANCETPH